MPRNKITTEAGSVDVQWSKSGQLVCLVVNDEMYQFTDADELTQAIASLRRARRQAFREGKPTLSSDEERFVDQDGRPLHIWDGHSKQ